MQFLSLFAIISLRKYPKNVNKFIKSQTLLNLNMIPISFVSFISFVPCSDFANETNLDYNISNHPAINCSLYLCNCFSMMVLFLLPISLSIFSFLLARKISKMFLEMVEWNGFFSIIFGSLLEFTLISLVQIIYVILFRVPKNYLGFKSHLRFWQLLL